MKNIKFEINDKLNKKDISCNKYVQMEIDII